MLFFLIIIPLSFSSCARRMGYGVLLWSVEDPPILSGTVLPVFIRSNIEQIWVVGIPEYLQYGRILDKIEVPLAHLEFVGSRNRAFTRAGEFGEFAHIYAENLQDGLPIRESPDNASRRVYRLRAGDIVKVLGRVQGTPPISTTGDPLPGDWLRVLTSDGVSGYCFSFRLRLFDQSETSFQLASTQTQSVIDTDLEMIFSRTWSPDFYLQMINSRRIDLHSFEQRYRFEPGQDTGVARIILPDLERHFNYERIIPDGDRSWRFEGTTLTMTLRTNNSLAVQFIDAGGLRRILSFVVLPSDINNIIQQENARREEQFMTIFNQGSVFTSSNFGTISFISTGDFTWTGFELLVPQLFPAETSGNGRLIMDLFIPPSLESQFDGAFTLQFTDIRTNNTFFFLYALDNQGIRLEVVPAASLENSTVARRASSPIVMFFFRDTHF